jgi:hypothetical protein
MHLNPCRDSDKAGRFVDVGRRHPFDGSEKLLPPLEELVELFLDSGHFRPHRQASALAVVHTKVIVSAGREGLQR